jgi:hypothetical protein
LISHIAKKEIFMASIGKTIQDVAHSIENTMNKFLKLPSKEQQKILLKVLGCALAAGIVGGVISGLGLGLFLAATVSFASILLFTTAKTTPAPVTEAVNSVQQEVQNKKN